MFVWCTVSVRTRSYLHYGNLLCLYGVPYVCLVYRLCSVLSYSHWPVFIMSVWCTVSICTGSYLHWWGFLVFVWCTVYVLGLYHVCMVYRSCTHAVVLTLMGLYRVCMVYRLWFVSSFSHCWEFFIFVWCTLCILSQFKLYCQAFCCLVAAFTTVSAVTFSCSH